MTQRAQTAPATDTALVPNRDFDLVKLTLADDNDSVVDLTTVAFTPLILQVSANGAFHAGGDAPSQTNDLAYPASTIHSFPVNGAASWHFKRASGAGTIEIRIKVLGSN